jgi:hypothetical protein
MSETWDEIIKPIALAYGGPFGVSDLKKKDIGKPFPGGTNVRLYVNKWFQRTLRARVDAVDPL